MRSMLDPELLLPDTRIQFSLKPREIKLNCSYSVKDMDGSRPKIIVSNTFFLPFRSILSSKTFIPVKSPIWAGRVPGGL